uniref:Uncharacterized protein n=1 Tax=Globodera rostochiensis TaxID=31243 RepID=A0A914H4R0_GLORO
MKISANAIILAIISLATCNFKGINGIKCIRELYAINISEKSSSPSECSTNLSCVSVICLFDNKEFVYAKDCVQADRPVDYVSITKECKALKGDDAFTRPNAFRARIKQCNSSDFCNERMLYWNLTTAKHISMPATTLHATKQLPQLTNYNDDKAHENDDKAHDNDDKAHDNDDKAHENDDKAHDNDDKAHENDDKAHDNDDKAHDNDDKAHENDDKAHENDDKAHENDDKAHDNDDKAHENDDKAHDNDDKAHENDDKAHDNDDKAHENGDYNNYDDNYSARNYNSAIFFWLSIWRMIGR